MRELHLIPAKHSRPRLIALVDDEDFEELNKYSWSYTKIGRMIYPTGTVNGGTVRLHIFLFKDVDRTNLCIDHINGNTLDNRRSNLRLCTQQQNTSNRKKPKGNFTSKYKGVHFYKAKNKYIAQITVNYKIIHLGSFNTELAAAKAYNRAAIKHHGEFAKLNIIE